MTSRPVPVAVLGTVLVTVPLTALATLWWTARPRPTDAPIVASSVPPTASRSDPARTDPPKPAAADPPALAQAVDPPRLVRTDIAAWAAGARRVAATDLDGDGDSEIALVGADVTVVTSTGQALATTPAAGGINVLEGFGGAFYAGWGRDKDAPNASASIVRYTLRQRALSAETVVAPTTTRPQIVAISPAKPAGLLLAWFSDKYGVTAVRGSQSAKRAPWTLTSAAATRTAPVWLSTDLDGDGVDDLVYGRTYGDAVGSSGDAWVVRSAGGDKVAIPTTGGVRAGCLADTDGDGRPEVVLADGWDKDYGHLAKAEIRLVTWVNGAVQSVVLDRSPGDYDVTRLLAADLDGDGKQEILAVTNTKLRVISRRGSGWVAWDAASGTVDAAVALGRGGPTVVAIGPKPEALVIGR